MTGVQTCALPILLFFGGFMCYGWASTEKDQIFLRCPDRLVCLAYVLMEYVQFWPEKFVRCCGFTNEKAVVIIQSRCENDSILEHIKNMKNKQRNDWKTYKYQGIRENRHFKDRNKYGINLIKETKGSEIINFRKNRKNRHSWSEEISFAKKGKAKRVYCPQEGQ